MAGRARLDSAAAAARHANEPCVVCYVPIARASSVASRILHLSSYTASALFLSLARVSVTVRSRICTLPPGDFPLLS